MYKPRLTKPERGNKYYITKSRGGYSSAIEGKCQNTGKPDSDCNVLANCVGYAIGRFNEIGGYNTCKYTFLSNKNHNNAENFIENRGTLSVGTVPKEGAIMVWQKGDTLKGTDGAGHVAIVEKVISEREVVISQSGYNSKPFWTETIKYNKNWNCNWMGKEYKFLGFIYNPAVEEEMVKEININYNGKLTKVHTILKDGTNYIKLAELDTVLNLAQVTYDTNKKIPVVNKK